MKIIYSVEGRGYFGHFESYSRCAPLEKNPQGHSKMWSVGRFFSKGQRRSLSNISALQDKQSVYGDKYADRPAVGMFVGLWKSTPLIGESVPEETKANTSR